MCWSSVPITWWLNHVNTGPIQGTLRVIETGLTADDLVVVGGLQRAVPGDQTVDAVSAAAP